MQYEAPAIHLGDSIKRASLAIGLALLVSIDIFYSLENSLVLL